MENKSMRIAWAWVAMAIGVMLGYFEYLILAVLMGTLAVIVAGADKVKFFGDEEEPNDEEEL